MSICGPEDINAHFKYDINKSPSGFPQDNFPGVYENPKNPSYKDKVNFNYEFPHKYLVNNRVKHRVDKFIKTHKGKYINYYIQKGYDIYELHIVHFIGVDKINGKLNIILKSV